MKSAVEKTARKAETPVRSHSLTRIDELMREVERFWERSFPFRLEAMRHEPDLRLPEFDWSPRIDLWEKEGELCLRADLPGLEKKNIEIFFDQGDLVLKGERKEEKEVREENLYRSERFHGTFHRRIPLGFDLDPKLVKAELKGGVLELRIPMPKETGPEPQRIPIV